MLSTDKHYLELLSRSFPNAASASAEIINLNAILNLPKGTEFFASDIHGEHDAFSHILRNAAGSIRDKIEDVFRNSMSDAEKQSFATLVYYPEEKMALMTEGMDEDELNEWYNANILHLVELCRVVARKYTRSYVRKAMPAERAYIIEELLTERGSNDDKRRYYRGIVDAIIGTGSAADMIVDLAELIQHLSISHLHIVGDIYDRGPAPDTIMDMLSDYHSLDIQWGNHDVVWMGAALGQRGCIAHVVRNCARYGNLHILEDAYGINLLPLVSFARRAYADDPCVAFGLKGSPDLPELELEANIKVQKAMAIIQFKVEGAIIDEYPEFDLEDRKLLDKIDYEAGTVVVDGIEYELTDKVFPTIDPTDPFRLTEEEEQVISRLEKAFIGSEKLQRHIRFMLNAGSMYKVYNNTLMFHAAVPLNEDGSLQEVDIFGEKLAGKALYDKLELFIRDGFYSKDPAKRKIGRDMLWWLWLAPGSPQFAKSKMATFELYLIADKAARKEVKNPYFSMLDNVTVVNSILKDFGLDPNHSRIVCGHVPVKVKDGEDPIKCGGKVLCIDGGFSAAYQSTTGIAGYTLVSNSYGFVLAAHEPLESKEAAIIKELDIYSSERVVEKAERRTMVADTDIGSELKQQIAELEELLKAYRKGIIPERR